MRLLRRLLGGEPAPSSWLGSLVGFVRKLGPYAVIELLLPGGTLIIVAVWLYRRYRARAMSIGVAQEYA
ncbi:MAG TPA: hypothetical protein VEY89_06860 [Candidatus Dormibacteraeota bacterium]|nr:hypothetical protein [Candidatus Dormibacteraeota bacterium]